jgi:DNA polymerase I-like protein with 3'-5' exonuclease and polymerase domains
MCIINNRATAMRLLVNYDKAEKNYLPMLDGILRKSGHTAAVTSKPCSIVELTERALIAGCSGILIINPITLQKVTGMPKATLDDWRGSRIDTKVKAIVCNSLKQLMTVPHAPWILDQDLEKLHWLNWEPPTHTINVVKKTSDLMMATIAMKDSLLAGVDIETNGEDIDKFYSRQAGKLAIEEGRMEVKPVYITSIALTMIRTNGSIESWAVPFVDFDSEYWGEGELAKVIIWLRQIMDTDTPKIFHNGVYDLTHLINYWAFPRCYFWDTIGAAHAEYAELPRNLAYVASYSWPHYRQWKFEAKEAAQQRSIGTLLRYNVKDTYWTLLIAIRQLCLTDQWVKVNNAKTFKMVASVMYSALEGALIDNKVRMKALGEAEVIKAKAVKELRIMAGDSNFNPGSWQQKEALLYGLLGAIKPRVGVSKSCTDEKNLLAVARQHPLLSMFVSRILDYQSKAKAIGTYFKFRQKCSRLLFELNPWGTDTGRMASRASNFNCGTQVQNIPYYGKKQLVPEDGFTWIQADFSKAEAVCTAFLSCCTKLIAAATDKEYDFYKNLATIFFHMAYEDVTKEFRNKVMKKIVHGTNYMMGAKTFTENMGVDNMYMGAEILGITLTGGDARKAVDPKNMSVLAFANFLIELYHKPFPEIRQWYKATERQLQTQGRIVSPTGWTRLFFGNMQGNHRALRGAVAHQPQNLSVFLLNDAMFDVYKYRVIAVGGLKDFMLKGQVHDSIISRVRTPRLQEALLQMRTIMTRPTLVNYDIIKKPMEINVDFEVSTKSYGELVEVSYDADKQQFILPAVF